MRFKTTILTGIVFLLTGALVLLAQAETCPPAVVEAVRAIGGLCENLDRNSACYGSDHVDVAFSQPVDAGTFDQPSDRAALDLFQSIQTTPLNTTTGQWGAAVLKLQANIPGALPGQMVTLLLIGDTRVQNVATGTQTPMQAFNFTTGVSPNCAEVPPSSLILQGPRGMVVDLTINGAHVRLGSTAVLRVEDDRVEFSTLDGRVVIDGNIILSKGFEASAGLDEDGLIIDESWSDVELIDGETLEQFESFEFLSDDIFEYEMDLPEAEELAWMDAFDADFIDSLDPYMLDAIIAALLDEGIDPAEFADLSLDDYYDLLAAHDPDMADAYYEAFTGEDIDGDGLIGGFDPDAYYFGDGFYGYDDAFDDFNDAFDDGTDEDDAFTDSNGDDVSGDDVSDEDTFTDDTGSGDDTSGDELPPDDSSSDEGDA